MGRRRKLVPITSTTINISLETLDTISRYKNMRETQDRCINRVLIEWQSSREIIRDLELAGQYNYKRIEQFELELDKLRNQIENNPVIQ